VKRIGLAVLGLVLLGVAATYALWFRLASIASDDMQPSLGRDATVLVRLRAVPERGDLVVFEHDGQPMLRRVIGLPGERVELDGFAVVVDGERASYQPRYHLGYMGRTVDVKRETLRGVSQDVIDDPKRRRVNVPPTETGTGYFVMADHREYGTDSTDIGVVAADAIRGVVVGVVTRGQPLERAGE
jgi:signal peptidase I